MAGFQTAQMPRPRFGNGAPAMPIVDIRLVGRKEPPLEIRPNGLAKVTPTLVAKIRRLDAQGLSRAEIAKACLTTPTTVRLYCKAPDGEDRTRVNRTPRKPFNVEKALRMKRAGFSYLEIGQDQGIGDTRAAELIKRALGEEVAPKSRATTPAGRFLKHGYAITGFKRADIFLQGGDVASGGRTGLDIAKARHLFFWLFCRRLGMTYAAAGAYLGGFDPTSVRYGVARVEAAGAACGIKMDGSRIGTFRRLWAASWPKQERA